LAWRFFCVSRIGRCLLDFVYNLKDSGAFKVHLMLVEGLQDFSEGPAFLPVGVAHCKLAIIFSKSSK
jgi:hypothetical protein